MLNISNITYSIGQVSEITGVTQSTLRYWETVIVKLMPQKTDGGSRRYSETDIKLVATVKELLYEKGYTIKGANKYLEGGFSGQNMNTQKTEATAPLKKEVSKENTEQKHILEYIYLELEKIKEILNS